MPPTKECAGTTAPQRFACLGPGPLRGRPQADQAKRTALLARAFSASSSRLRGRCDVSIESSSSRAHSAIERTARSNAASFRFDGLVVPLSFRTNCNAASWISSSVAGGSKLNSVLMFLHMTRSRLNLRQNVDSDLTMRSLLPIAPRTARKAKRTSEIDPEGAACRT